MQNVYSQSGLAVIFYYRFMEVSIWPEEFTGLFKVVKSILLSCDSYATLFKVVLQCLGELSHNIGPFKLKCLMFLRLCLTRYASVKCVCCINLFMPFVFIVVTMFL